MDELLDKWINLFLNEKRYLTAIKYCQAWMNCTLIEAKKYVDKIKWERFNNN